MNCTSKKKKEVKVSSFCSFYIFDFLKTQLKQAFRNTVIIYCLYLHFLFFELSSLPKTISFLLFTPFKNGLKVEQWQKKKNKQTKQN